MIRALLILAPVAFFALLFWLALQAGVGHA